MRRVSTNITAKPYIKNGGWICKSPTAVFFCFRVSLFRIFAALLDKKIIMKKILLIALTGLIVMGSFTSCKKEKEETEFKQKIVGRWKAFSYEGMLLPTNSKAVDELFADGTSICTDFSGKEWICSQARTYNIDGNKYKKYDGEQTTLTATIVAINDSYMKFINGYFPTIYTYFDEYVMERVNVDYSKSVVGLWEGVEMTGSETYGGVNYRCRYNDNGTYVYYTQNGQGEWVVDPSDTSSNYYVAGNLLGSCWYLNGIKYSECWDIDYCNDTEMKLSALRMNDDNSLFTTTMTFKRVAE